MNKSPRDTHPQRFFQLMALRLVELAQAKLGDMVLVLEPSSDALALYAGAKVGPTGQVICVPGKANGELRADDLLHLQFRNNTFDRVFCSTAIFLLPDMAAGLHEWRRVLKPGGTVAFSGYGERTFQPLAKHFEACLHRYGVSLVSGLFAWQRLTDLEAFSELLRSAAFSGIDVRSEQLGYYLANGDEWWDLLWQSDVRYPLAQLAPDVLGALKAEHLAAVAKLATERGLWLNVTAIFAVGQKG